MILPSMYLNNGNQRASDPVFKYMCPTTCRVESKCNSVADALMDKMPMSGSGYNGPVIDSQYTVKRAINQLLDEKQITIDDVRDCVHVIQPILLSMGTNKKHGYTTASKQSRRH